MIVRIICVKIPEVGMDLGYSKPLKCSSRIFVGIPLWELDRLTIAIGRQKRQKLNVTGRTHVNRSFLLKFALSNSICSSVSDIFHDEITLQDSISQI